MGASLARLRNDGTGVNPVLNGALIRCGRDRSRVRRPGRRTNRSRCQATIFREAARARFPALHWKMSRIRTAIRRP